MSFTRILIPIAAAGAFLSVTSFALADSLPPDAEDCQSKSTGAACHTENGDAGVCTEQQCGHTSESCYMAAVDAGTDAAACETDTPCEICVAGSSPASTTDGGPTTTTPASSSSSGGCNVGGKGISDVARAGAPFALAALVPILIRRRKKRGDQKDQKKG